MIYFLRLDTGVNCGDPGQLANFTRNTTGHGYEYIVTYRPTCNIGCTVYILVTSGNSSMT